LLSEEKPGVKAKLHWGRARSCEA